jgi:hypothetical protein
VGSIKQRGLWLAGAGHRRDLSAFVGRAVRTEAAAVIRLRARSDGLLTAWAGTGLDVLASRAVAGRLHPADVCVDAGELARGLADVDGAGYVDPGAAVDSAWRGALPPEAGFSHLDDVPVEAVRELAQRGVQLAKEHGRTQGPPDWLLDQEVVRVSSADTSVGIPMRCVFALTAMGFLSPPPNDGGTDEAVRVRIRPSWLRIDARFGSVYRRRGDPPLLLR